MLIEMRTYHLQPTRVTEYLSLYEERGLALQRDVLGNLVACFTSEVGALNQVIYLWGFPSFKERMQRRSALATLPAWQAYVVKVAPLFVSQESKLLFGTAFSPIR